jgi:MFS family permease
LVEIPIDFYAEVVATIAMGVVAIAMLMSYLKDPERDKRTLGISTGYLFFALATLAGLLGILLVLMGYPASGMPLFVERFVYIFVAIGVVPFTYFTVKLFFAGAKWPTYMMTIFAIVLTVVYLIVQDAVVSIGATVWNTNLLTGVALLLMTSVVFIVLCVKCFQTAGKTKETLVKRRFNLIGLAALFGVLIFIVNAITVLFDPSVVPYISAISWSLSAVAGILSYVGWIRFRGSKKA